MKTSPLPSGSQKPRSDAPFAADSESRPPASNRLAAVCRKSCSRTRRKPGRSRATRHRQRAWSAACGACSSSQRRGDGGGHRYDASRSLSLGGDEGEASVGLALQRAFDGDEVVVEVDVAPAESWRLALTRAEGQVDDPGWFASVFGGDLKECLGLLDRVRADLRVRGEGGSTSTALGWSGCRRQVARSSRWRPSPRRPVGRPGHAARRTRAGRTRGGLRPPRSPSYRIMSSACRPTQSASLGRQGRTWGAPMAFAGLHAGDVGGEDWTPGRSRWPRARS